MSTQINVTVGSGGLSDKARQLQTAARQAQLEKERQQRLEVQGAEQRNAKLEAEGKAPDGSPLYGSGFKQPEVERRPAANRSTFDSYVYYLPTEPNFSIELLDGGGVGGSPFLRLDTDYTIYKNRRAIPPFNYHLFIQHATHTPSYTYSTNGGPYGEPSIEIVNPPPAGLLSQGMLFNLGPVRSTTYTSVGVQRPFTELTLELDFASTFSNNFLFSQGVIALDVEKNLSFRASWSLSRGFGSEELALGLNVAVVNETDGSVVQTLCSYFDLGDSDVLAFPDLQLWRRYAFVVRKSSATFFVNGASILTVPYASSLEQSLSLTTTTMSVSNQFLDDAKLCAASFTPKALYSAQYTPRSLLR